MSAEDRPNGPGSRTGLPNVDRDVDALLEAANTQADLPTGLSKREALDLQEQEIKDAVLRMGALVEEAIRRAAHALVAHDATLALDVVKSDTRINDAQREVSRLISVAIATQAPVARDLRYLLTLDHGEVRRAVADLQVGNVTLEKPDRLSLWHLAPPA